MAFTPPKIIEIVPEEVPKYNHGYSEEEVSKITNTIKNIELRDLINEPVSFEEFKNYVVPWFRIKRTEDFILKEVKPKATKGPKTPKVTKPKAPKKMTKKAIQDELTRLLFKQVSGQALTPEEQAFYNNPTGEVK